MGTSTPPNDHLASLAPSHPYRMLDEGRYRPTGVADDSTWQAARSAAIEIVAADHAGHQRPRLAEARRTYVSLLCHHLALEDPGLLRPEIVLSEDEIVRFAAVHGDRRALNNESRHAVVSALRSLRTGFPSEFPTWQPDLGGTNSPANPPTTQVELKAAMHATHAIRRPCDRDAARCVMLAARGAGLDSTPLSHLCGRDIEQRAYGVWAVVHAPGQEREVPILQRYAGPLLARARRRPDVLLTGATAPGDTIRVASLLGRVNHILSRDPGAGRVSAERLRKAWLLEHAHNTRTYNPWFLEIAGLRWTNTLDTLLQQYPAPEATPEDLAKRFGALS